MKTSSFPSNLKMKNDVTSDQVQSWTAKNASLLRKQEYDLISRNFRHMFRKEKYKLVDIDLDDNGDIVEKQNNNCSTHKSPSVERELLPREILKKMSPKDQRRLANFGKVTPRFGTAENQYVKKCNKYAVVPSKSLILANKAKATKFVAKGKGITSISVHNMLPLLNAYKSLHAIDLSDNPLGPKGSNTLMSSDK